MEPILWLGSEVHAGIPNIPCLAHILQLSVKDGCLAQTAVLDLTEDMHT